MKNIVYLLFASVLIITGCSEEYELNDNDGNYNVDLLPGYVAFSAPGANITIDDIVTDESGADLELNVEVPTGTLSDVTVNFVFGGTAVYGVDFSVAGGSSAGGSIVIEHTQSGDTADYLFNDNADIVVDLLTDDVIDGVKTLSVTLESASNGFSVGRGGTDLLKTTNITINDFCVLLPSTIVGDWVLDMQDAYGDGWNGASVTFEIDGVGTDYDLDTYTGDGATATVTITIPAGAQTLKFFYNSGAWDSEVTFQISGPTGTELGSYGLSPSIGEFTVDACAF
jgi:hypothetical protein